MQGFINDLIIKAEQAEVSFVIYQICNNSSAIIGAIFCILYGKKLKIPFFKRLFVPIVEVSMLIGIMSVLLWVEVGFRYFGKQELAVALTYLPLIAYLYSKLFRVEFFKAMDLMAFQPLSMHFFSRIGCVFACCCYGISNEYGIYNFRTGHLQFPVQLVESLVVLIVFVLFLCIMKKQQYIAK